MLKIQNQQIIHAAFDVALFNINNTNCNKHFNSKYKPLVSTTMETSIEKDDNSEVLICYFDNNIIYAIYDNDACVLKKKSNISITLKKDFASFRDAVDYFTRVIHHKIFK